MNKVKKEEEKGVQTDVVVMGRGQPGNKRTQGRPSAAGYRSESVLWEI